MMCMASRWLLVSVLGGLALGALGAACNSLTGADQIGTTSTGGNGGAAAHGGTTPTGSTTSSGGHSAGSGGTASGGTTPTGGGGTSSGGTTPTGGGGGAGGTDNHVCSPQGVQDCSQGSGSGQGPGCGDTPSCYLSAMQSVENGLINAHPDWFTWDDAHSCWFILDVDTYLDAVVAGLEALGLCALRDPNAPMEEITVKRNNDFAESFDIVASFGCARTGAGIYTGFCAPAWW